MSATYDRLLDSEMVRAALSKAGGVHHRFFEERTGALALARLERTPGGGAMRCAITVSPATARKVSTIGSQLPAQVEYEKCPEEFERLATNVFGILAPEVIGAIDYARAHDAVLIEVRGLKVAEPLPPTPLDGKVVEADVRGHVINLIGALGCCGLTSFAYQSENEAKLLRAVVPVRKLTTQASSQGSAQDLLWHQDNANRHMLGVPDCHPGGRGPMNPYQAFVAVRPDDEVPMEVVALGDIVRQTAERHGDDVVERLQLADFAIDRPASHGGGRDVEGVPLLLRDARGAFHSRLHANNVSGLTSQAQSDFDRLRDVANATSAVMKLTPAAGTIILYSNTQCLHRRRKFTARFDGTDRYYIRAYMMPTEQPASITRMVQRVFA